MTVAENIQSIIDDINRIHSDTGVVFDCSINLSDVITYKMKSDGLQKLLLTVVNNNPERSRRIPPPSKPDGVNEKGEGL
jgi:hypothetical protein